MGQTMSTIETGGEQLVSKQVRSISTWQRVHNSAPTHIDSTDETVADTEDVQTQRWHDAIDVMLRLFNSPPQGITRHTCEKLLDIMRDNRERGTLAPIAISSDDEIISIEWRIANHTILIEAETTSTVGANEISYLHITNGRVVAEDTIGVV